MSIYIYKNNQQSGPFEESKILEWLKSGNLSSEDMAVRQGDKGWQSLRTLFPNTGAAVPSAAVQSNANAGVQVSETGKSANKMRLIFGVLFVLSFLGFHLFMVLMTFSFGSFAKINIPSTILFAAAFGCLFISAVLLLLLAVGVGAKNGMSRWRTPLLCVLVLLWSFGLGSFVLYSQQSTISDDKLVRTMDEVGLKETDLIYQDVMSSIERRNKMAQGAYGLFGVGALSGLGAIVSIVVAGRKKKSAV